MGSLPELTPGRLFISWQWDLPALLLVALLGGLYGWGVLRLRRRGEPWPVARGAAFGLFGLGALVVATMSALAVYDRVLFWPAAVQNILLDLIAPLGLALGDPLRLALRALPEPAAGRVRRAMTGRTVRLLTFPLVSTVLVLATELTVYFTPYFETALRVGWLHQVMYLHLLLAGCLFVVPVLTREEALPRWCTHPVRAALVFLDGIVDAVPGIVVMTHGTLIAGAWYLHHAPAWAPDVQYDQQSRRRDGRHRRAGGAALPARDPRPVGPHRTRGDRRAGPPTGDGTGARRTGRGIGAGVRSRASVVGDGEQRRRPAHPAAATGFLTPAPDQRGSPR